MKKQYLLALLMLLLCLNEFAQAPQGINYQAVVRDASGHTVAAGTMVSIRFTIHNGSAGGQQVFQEIDTPTTNQFGLVTVVIGNIQSLAAINWGNGAKFLQVELDPAGGSNLTDMGTTQLMSVPYALFAGNAANGTTGATGATGQNGLNGATGATGATGLQGTAGNNGVTGAVGQMGSTGIQGAGYYRRDWSNGRNGINRPYRTTRNAGRYRK